MQHHAGANSDITVANIHKLCMRNHENMTTVGKEMLIVKIARAVNAELVLVLNKLTG